MPITSALLLVAALAAPAAAPGAPAPAAAAPAPPAYDPLRLEPAAAGVEASTLDLSLRDPARSRELPLRVYLPTGKGPFAAILYSHGLGGSRGTSAFLGKQWARRGYLAVFLQHPGSDESIWIDKPPDERLAALKEAASVEQFLARAADVKCVLDALAAWNAAPGHPLRGLVDLERIGMSGHSFGALTAQALSGQSPSRGPTFTDPRIKAAVIFSPSLPKRGDPAEAFSTVAVPWLLMTGTRDAGPITDITPESRQRVFALLPPGRKYQLVLDGAEHSIFTDTPLPGDQAPRNPRHHPAIEALSTAFWDAFLRGDAAARSWLDGQGPSSLLAPADRWERR